MGGGTGAHGGVLRPMWGTLGYIEGVLGHMGEYWETAGYIGGILGRNSPM